VIGVAVGQVVLATPLALALFALFSLGVAGAVFYMTRPKVGPTRMPGAFNIAVASFGKQTPNGVTLSDDGTLMSQQVFEGLVDDQHDLFDKGVRAAIWHDSLPLEQKGTTIGVVADPVEARKAAERLNADVLIYGMLENSQSSTTLTLRFYSRVLHEEAGEIIGSHRLGSPVRVVLPFDAANPARFITVQALVARTKAMITFAQALADLKTSEPGAQVRAADDFKRVADTWPAGIGGKEVPLVFEGREERLNGHLDLALGIFEDALKARPEYARAVMGEANVHYDMTGCGASGSDAQRLNATLLVQAIGEFSTARDLAEAPIDDEPDSLIQMRTHLGLGLAQQCLTEYERAVGRFAAATTALAQAEDELQSVQDLAIGDEDQQIAQAYYLEGLVAWSRAGLVLDQPPADPAAVAAALNESAAAFDKCQKVRDDHDQRLPGEQDAFLSMLASGPCASGRKQANDWLAEHT
jgi:hypothetical protein